MGRSGVLLKASGIVFLGMEEGNESDVPGQEFGLCGHGEPAAFRFLKFVPAADKMQSGTLFEEWGKTAGRI